MDVWNFKLETSDMEKINNLNTGEDNQNTMAGWLREQDPDYY